MASQEEDWAAVLDRLLEGDRLAFVQLSQLVTGFLARLRAYDFRDEWHDLVQEVLTAAMKAVREGRLRDRGATFGYVRAITRNLFNRRLAQHMRRGEDQLQAWDEACSEEEKREDGATSADPERVLEMRRALSKLPPQKAEVLLGVYGCGRTYEQVSRDTGIPLGTVKRYLSEGLAQLRKGLSGAYDLP